MCPEEDSGALKRREGRVRVIDVRRIEVKYKLLSNEDEYACEEIFAGVIHDLSRGGALLEGVIPDPTWVPALTDGTIKVGMFIYLPQLDAVKALCCVRWIKPADGAAPEENRYAMGLRFDEISDEHKKNLGKFLISFTLTRKKLS